MAEINDYQIKVEEIQKKLEIFTIPIVEYFNNKDTPNEKKYLFLVALMSNVYEWLRIYCSKNDLDYNVVMARIVLNMHDSIEKGVLN